MSTFEINAFSRRLIELFLGSNLFPYMKGNTYVTKNGRVQDEKVKHKNRDPRHLRTATRHSIDNSYVSSENLVTFDIGNEQMEIMHPYYHILQDSPYIRKAGMSTTKTRGSQAKIEKGKRDYNIVSWNGKTFTQEYRRNVRGSRSRLAKVSHWEQDSSGNNVFVNRESNTYANIHYQYIDRILDSGILKDLASEFGLKTQRKSDSGLVDEFATSLGLDISTILDIFQSFED